jgi:hypothetical protein
MLPWKNRGFRKAQRREEENMEKQKTTRRQFLRGAAAAGAAMAAGGMVAASGSTLVQAATIPSSVPEETTDVVVVGGGIAGLVASIRATQQGARVTLIDKLGRIEGLKIDGRRLTGLLGRHPWEPDHPDAPLYIYGYGNETSLSQGQIFYLGDKRNMQRILEGFKDHSWGRGNIPLSRKIAEIGPGVFKWLQDLGVDTFKANKIAPDGQRWQGRHWPQSLYAVAEPRGVKLIFKTRAVDLIIDASGRRVIGVAAIGPEGRRNYVARNGVVLATGSFEGNEAMKLQYLEPRPEMARILVSGSPTNTGDGIIMAQRIGAKLLNLETSHIRTPDAVAYGEGPSRALGTLAPQPVYQRCIYVNLSGDRFVDENADSDTVAHTILHQTRMLVYLVWDDKLYKENEKIFDTYVQRTIKESPVSVTKEQLILVSESPEQLAVKMKVPVDRFKKTVEEYNAAVKADGTASGLSVAKIKNAVKLDTPPFYAHSVTCAMNQGLGGIATNANMEVINTEDEVIPGLYACGSTIWYHYGQTYEIGGVQYYKTSYRTDAGPPGLGYSSCTGYLAGENAGAAKTG